MNDVPERELPPGRHRALREHLLTEIRQSEAIAPEASPKKFMSPKKNKKVWLRSGIAATALAAAAVAGVLVASPFGDQSAQAAPSKETVKMLEEIAEAAKRSPEPKLRDDQFVYIKSKVSYSSDGAREPLHVREFWESVDGRHTGMLHEPVSGHRHDRMEPELPLLEDDDYYRNLQKLPTDPVNMRDWLNRIADENSNGKPFVVVGDLIRESLMPSKQAAALYLAATEIPGVELVEDAVDASGRHGIAIAWEDDGSRQELIFDKETKKYLGEREVLTEDKPFGKKGKVLASTAVLERIVVDKAGQRP
ncbi:CU044_5270 family protein [Streptomyces sp. NPDC059009]|uniref:CU044_5270 family protein n=1 Tax=Streptomyces sp. NPDC059009 TaxID=3346694 RepID=UPI0036B19AD5